MTGSITGNVSLGNNSTLQFGRNNPYSFGGMISGTGSVEQVGNSILTLSGNNNYSGGTRISSGDLVVTNSNALGTGPITLGNGAELRASGNVVLNNVKSDAHATATLSATPGSTLTLNNFDNGNLIPRYIFGSAGNTGTVVIGSSGADDTGFVEVAFGTLANGGGLGVLTTDSGSPTTMVNAGATLDLRDNGITIGDLEGAGTVVLGTKVTTTLILLGLLSPSFGGVIKGAGQVDIGARNVTLTGANTYTGGTTVEDGAILEVGNGGMTGSITGPVSLGSNSAIQFQRNTPYSFSGMISGPGEVGQFGSGALTLSGMSSYTGGTTIGSTSTLIVSNSSALGSGAVTLLNGAELRGSGTVTLANLVNFFNPTTNATLSAATGGTFTLNHLDISNTAAITFGSSGNTGTVVIGPNAADSKTGNSVTVAFGTLRNGGGLGALTQAGNITTVNAGATLDVHDVSVGISSLAGSGKVTLGTQKATILFLDGGNFDGVISGAGSLDIDNLVIFTGANIYTGNTKVDALSDLQLGNGGTTGSVVGGIGLGNNADVLFDHSGAYTFGGVISGHGAVQQNGSGVVTLTSVNSYQLGTLINNGVLVAANSGALGSGPAFLNTGTELRGKGAITLANTVEFDNGTTSATLSAATGSTLTLNNLDVTNTGTVTFGSAGNTGTVVVGPGVTANNPLSSIDVEFGTLRNGGGLTALSDAASHTFVNSGATLALNDISSGIFGLTGSGSVNLGTNAATTLNLSSSNFAGVIGGAGGVDITSPSTFTGANTYKGGTLISNGQTLTLGSGTTGSIVGSVSISSGAALEFDRSNPYNFSGAISGLGGVQQNGTGVLTLSGANSYTGGTMINSGVLVVPNAGALGNGPVTLGSGAELRSSGTVLLTDPITFSGAGASSATISTTGILTLPNFTDSGSGLLIFGSSGNAGTVGIPSGGSLSAASLSRIEVAFGTLSNGGGLNALTSNAQTTRVNQGATLSLSDFSTTINNLTGNGTVKTGTKSSTVLTLAGAFFQGNISGAGQVNAIGGGSGLVDFLTANTYTGGTTVSVGGLVANNPTGSATGTGPVTINGGASIGGSGTVSGAMTLDSGGTVKPSLNSGAGTKFHGSSLLWEGGGTLDFQIGSTTDQLLLTGALTKGTAGAFTINIVNDTIVTGSYTLATFASTTFSLSDFTLVLPNNVSGTLVENSQSLVLDITQAELPAHSEDLTTPADAALASTAPDSSFNESSALTTITPTPEPGSSVFLSLGLAGLLSFRRRNRPC
jgi:autotransporter-associated beta strand protein